METKEMKDRLNDFAIEYFDIDDWIMDLCKDYDNKVARQIYDKSHVDNIIYTYKNSLDDSCYCLAGYKELMPINIQELYNKIYPQPKKHIESELSTSDIDQLVEILNIQISNNNKSLELVNDIHGNVRYAIDSLNGNLKKIQDRLLKMLQQ
jgi:hypothetical protein